MNPKHITATQAAELLTQSHTIVTTGHVSPDGDSYGAATGTAWAARQNGIQASACFSENYRTPDMFQFLKTRATVTNPTDITEPVDLLIVFDTGNKSRLHPTLLPLVDQARHVLVVDHHQGTPDFGDSAYTQPTSASAAELAYRTLKHTGWALDHHTATALMVGVTTDTGFFQYPNTKAETFRHCAELTDLGADVSVIHYGLYGKTRIESTHLYSVVANRAQTLPEHRVVWSWVTLKDLKDHNHQYGDPDNLVDIVKSTDNCPMGVLIREEPTDEELGHKWKVSLRGGLDLTLDLSEIARQLGGGGHSKAAGYVSDLLFQGPVMEELLRTVEQHGGVTTRPILP